MSRHSLSHYKSSRCKYLIFAVLSDIMINLDRACTLLHPWFQLRLKVCRGWETFTFLKLGEAAPLQPWHSAREHTQSTWIFPRVSQSLPSCHCRNKQQLQTKATKQVVNMWMWAVLVDVCVECLKVGHFLVFYSVCFLLLLFPLIDTLYVFWLTVISWLNVCLKCWCCLCRDTAVRQTQPEEDTEWGDSQYSWIS